MTLRKRLLWLFIPLLALTLAIAYGLSERILLSRFDQQDRSLLLNDAKRLRSLLDQALQRNLELLHGYSRWDDSYEFMQGKKPDFVRRNLDQQALAEMDFDFMLYLDLNGQVVTEQWLPPDLPEMLSAGNERPSNYASLRAAILQLGQRLAKHNAAESSDEGHAQLLVVQGTPLLLVASPITNNQGNTPPIGTIVAGYFLDAERFEKLQGQVDGSLRLAAQPPSASSWQHLPTAPGSSLSDRQISPRRLLDKQQQQIELLLNNDLNEPGLNLQISRPRRLYQEGQRAIRLFLTLSVAAGVSALLLFYLGLELWVLRRLQRIHREVTLIGPDSQQSRLSDQGRDELGQLAVALNKMFERLAQSETRDQLILDSINEGYFEIDARGQLVSANRALGNMLGYSDAELLNLSYKDLLNDEDIQRARELSQEADQDRTGSSFAAVFKRRDGSLGHFETRLAFFHDSQGLLAGCRGILRDTSEQMAYQNQLIDMAYRDPLTALGNRKAFGEQLHSSLELMQRKQQTLALLYLDLDHFKEVNDQYGHDVGDALLISIAERLRNSLRQPDWAYRLGGDEFTVLLPEADQYMAMKLAERLLKNLSKPFTQGNLLIDFVTPSIGIALYPEHAQYAEGLIKAADIAMYEAKQQRNRACVYQSAELSPPPQNG